MSAALFAGPARAGLVGVGAGGVNPARADGVRAGGNGVSPARADRVPDGPPGEWGGPFRSAYGWHLVRITDYQPAREGELDSVRARVRSDYLADLREQANRVAYSKIASKYRIVTAEPSAAAKRSGAVEAGPNTAAKKSGAVEARPSATAGASGAVTVGPRA